MSGAFHGDAGIKQDLIDRLPSADLDTREKSQALRALLPDPADSAASDAFARQFGLHRAFVDVVRQISLSSGPDFCAQALGELSPGANTLRIVRRWLLSADSEGTPSLRDRISDPEILHAADRITDLHRAAIAGETIDRRQWRQARAALAGKLGTSVEGMAVACLLAGAWDLDETPGAAADLMLGSMRLAFAEVDQKLDWTQEDDKEAAERQQERVKAAAAFAGAKPEGTNQDWFGTPEGKAWLERYAEGGRKFDADHPSKATDREAGRHAAYFGAYIRAKEDLLRAGSVEAAGPMPIGA